MIHFVFLGEVHEDRTFLFFIIIKSVADFDLGSSMLMCDLSTLIVYGAILDLANHADLFQVLVATQN